MKRLILIGGVPGPPLPEDWDGEIWGCNSLWPLAYSQTLRRNLAETRHPASSGYAVPDLRGFLATRWFELHPRWTNTPDEQQAVIHCPVPIYVLHAEEWPDAPRAVEYPLERAQTLGPWFASTFAYQMALALLEWFDEIHLYGVDLTCGSRRERTVERANLEWWLGFAEGRGVEIVHPADSGMSRQAYLYGYDYAAEVRDANRTVQGILEATQ